MTQPSTPEDTGTAQKHREGVTLAETRRSSMPDKQTQNNRAKAFLGNILIMPILCYIESSEDEDLTEDENCSQEGTVTGLLLSLLPGANHGIYRRVGIVQAWIEGDDEMDIHTVQQRFEAYWQPLDPQLFKKEDPYGNHIVAVL